MKRIVLSLCLAACLLLLWAVPAAAVPFADGLKIPKAVTPPVLDGHPDAAEWQNALTVDFDKNALSWVLQSARKPVESGSVFYLMWDEKALYCAVQIRDGELAVNPASGSALNAGDGVQMCFYTDEKAVPNDGHTNIFWDFLPYTGVYSAQSKPESYEHFAAEATTPEIPLAAAVTPGEGYTMEWAIGWMDFYDITDSFDHTFSGKSGDTIRLLLCLLNADGNGQSLGYAGFDWLNPSATPVYVLSSELTAGGKATSSKGTTADKSAETTEQDETPEEDDEDDLPVRPATGSAREKAKGLPVYVYGIGAAAIVAGAGITAVCLIQKKKRGKTG